MRGAQIGAKRTNATAASVGLFVACLLVSLVTACADEEPETRRLMDGSEAPTLSVELQGVPHPVVLTKVRAVQASTIGPDSLASSCIRHDPDSRPSGTVVERVGVMSESVTMRDASSPVLIGCDNSPGRRERDLRWCGGAHGMLYDGRLRDPRLSMVCESQDRQPMGFVWIHPRPHARYVAVIERDYTEVYGVAGDLPVRVSTATGVQPEGSRASFELAEHDAAGTLLRRYRLDAAVAG